MAVVLLVFCKEISLFSIGNSVVRREFASRHPSILRVLPIDRIGLEVQDVRDKWILDNWIIYRTEKQTNMLRVFVMLK